MAATFIQVGLADFERVFSMPRKDDPSRRAFELVRPPGSEAYYLCKLRTNEHGTLCVKVLTSVAADHASARDCGEDAIRACLYWQGKEGWEKGLGIAKRVNRSGGADRTAADVVLRALERAREVVECRGSFPACPQCGRPMVERKSARGAFHGCVAYPDCRGTRNIPLTPQKV